MSDSRDSLLRQQRIRARKGRKGRGESIYLVLRVREREHLLFALVPGFVHAWFSSTRDRVVFLFVLSVLLVIIRRRGLQSSSSVRHDDISLSRLCLVTNSCVTCEVSRGEVFYPKKIHSFLGFFHLMYVDISRVFGSYISSEAKH
jgi:hypothetical protein